MREILTELNTEAGGSQVAVMYFKDAPTIASQRTALATFWTAIAAQQSVPFVWRVRTEGVVLDPATGTLTGQWSETAPRTGGGTNADEPVPDASQALIRWQTANIVNGRFVRGRTFIPSMSRGTTIDGNLTNTAAAALTAAAQALVGSPAGLVVWSRPLRAANTGGIIRPGSEATVTGSSVWSEFAVLRRRRR